MSNFDQEANAINVERIRMEEFRIRLEDFILNSKETAATTVTNAIKASPIGLKVICSGFGGDLTSAGRVSFAEFCIKHNAVDVLQAVVESGLRGLTSKSTCCTTNQVGSMFSEGWSQSIHLAALRASNPQALQLAIKWDRKELCVTQNLLMGAMLHHSALSRVFGLEKVGYGIECCRILLQEKAPLIKYGSDIGIASGLFFDGNDWTPERAESITGLLSEYIAAGVVNLDEKPVGLKMPYEGMLPLRAAIAQGNVSGAVACIDLGCNIMKAMDFRSRERTDDVIELARRLTFDDANDPTETRAQMVAGIASAVMRKRLREDAGISDSVAPIAMDSCAPIRRQRMKV